MKRAIAMADNCIDVYYKLGRYYLTGNSIDFALNYKDMGGDVTEMTILGNDVFAMALKEQLKERDSVTCVKIFRLPNSNGNNGYCEW